MNKKGSILIIIFILIILVGVIFAVFFMVQKWKTNKEEPHPPLINLYLNAVDEETGDSIDANFYMTYGKETFVTSGNISNGAYTELRVDNSLTYSVRCWSNEYYMRRMFTLITAEGILANTSSYTCRLFKIGDLNITHTGSLQEGREKIALNISTKDTFQKVSICASWTYGIIDIEREQQIIYCNKGIWLNYSEYDQKTKKYTYLENYYHKCDNETFEQCEYVENNKCKIWSMDAPNRYFNKIDSCWYLGDILTGTSKEYDFYVNSKGLISGDKIIFYIFDKDKRYDASKGFNIWYSEFQGTNIGNPKDYVYNVTYKGG